VFSFTKAGAKEISSRLKERPAFVGTVHAYCFKQLALVSQEVMSSRDSFLEGLGNAPSLTEILSMYDLWRETLQEGTPTGVDPLAYSKIVSKYIAYKEEMSMLDFIDMLQESSTSEHAPVDNIVIDEGQDLTPLQWKVIKQIPCTNTIVAGDDDQCIYQWKGATPLEVGQGEEKLVLTKSHRLPRQVYEYSKTVLKHIRKREKKEFKPTDAEGEVTFVPSIYDLMGSKLPWAVLCRDNYVKRQVQDFCLQYMIPLKSVLEGKHGKAYLKGKEVPLKYIYYLKSVDRSRPIWEVRTIHTSKGMEWENVAVMSDLEGRTEEALYTQQGIDAEARVWYVAVTRASKRLHIIGNNTFLKLK